MRLAFKSPSQRSSAYVRRTLHYDKAGPFQMLDKALGDDLRHDLVGVLDALATLESEREGERLVIAF